MDSIPHEEYWQIYRRVPRLCVEVVITDPERGVILVQRAIEPFIGTWHLPGGTVRFGESLIDAVRRVALHEVGVGVNEALPMAPLEYPSHVAAGLDSPVSIPYLVISPIGDPCLTFMTASGRDESSAIGWHREVPPNMHVDQVTFLQRMARFLRHSPTYPKES